MTKIQSYDFGIIRIDDRIYRSDVLVTNEKVIENWFREKGHEVSLADIQKYIDISQFDVVIIGTGYYGAMKPDSRLISHLEKNGIKVMVMNTKDACAKFNELVAKKKNKVLAALHLTC